MKRIISAALLLFISGCAASANGTGVACPAVAVLLFVIYPASGSSNIVDAHNIVIVAGTGWESLTLTPAAGQAVVSTEIVPVPTPLPEPNATPLPAASAPAGTVVGTAFHIPPLAAATSYTVNATAASTSGSCSTVVESSSSFTTK